MLEYRNKKRTFAKTSEIDGHLLRFEVEAATNSDDTVDVGNEVEATEIPSSKPVAQNTKRTELRREPGYLMLIELKVNMLDPDPEALQAHRFVRLQKPAQIAKSEKCLEFDA